MNDAQLVNVCKCAANLKDPFVYFFMVSIYLSLIQTASSDVLHFYAKVNLLVTVGVMELDDVRMAA